MMETQNFKNHVRYVPGFHFVLSALIIASVIISSCILIGKLMRNEELSAEAILALFMSLSLVGLFWFSRQFALRAQDRAIRAEEAMRYYLLTNKPMPTELRMSQIVALRFASDAELPSLVQRAIAENMKANDIKKAILNWRGDYHRV